MLRAFFMMKPGWPETRVENMKAKLIGLALLGALAGLAPVLAEPSKSEYADYDDDLMHDLDRTIKVFEPDISGGNEGGVEDDIAVLRQGFQYTGKYFAKKGTAADAVKISEDGLKLLDVIQKDVAEQKIDAAAEVARSVADQCRSCHDLYKPKQARS